MAKIMYIHHNAYLGGGSLVAANTAKMLSAKHDVVLYVPEQGGDKFINYLSDMGLKYKRTAVPIPSFSYYSGSSSLFALNTIIKSIYSRFYKKQWLDLIKKESPDVVIVNSSTLSPMGKVIKKAGAKAVCLNWETFRSKGFNLGTRYMLSQLNNFDAISFTSNFDLNYSKLSNPYKTTFINPIRKGFARNESVDKKKACEILKVDADQFNILYVGGFGQIKGPDLMLEAMKHLSKHKKIQLIFAGQLSSLNLPSGLKGKLRAILGFKMFLYNSKINQLIKEVGDQISIVGLHSDVSNLYASADLVVCPSQSPHHLLPVHEAGLFGIPIVTTRYEQIKDHAIEDFNALLFEPGNSKDLADKIESIYLDPEKCASIGNNNLERAKINFNKERVENNINNIIDVVLNKNKTTLQYSLDNN